MKSKPITFVALFCVCSLVYAGQRPEITGKDLLAKMNSSAKADKDYVAGYVLGVYVAYSKRTTPVSEKELEPVIGAAKKYFESHPQKLNQPANILLHEVFDKSFLQKKK